MCDMMYNCTDPTHGTCGANGQCTCLNLHKGADCAYTALSPSHLNYPNITVKTVGKYWFYVSQNTTTDDQWTVTFTSNNVDFNIYISFGEQSNPNQFNHDIAIKGVPANKKFVLSKGIIPDGAFTAAVQVEGYYAYGNQSLENDLNVVYSN